MCIILWHTPAHQERNSDSPYALIIAANRDEFIDRPTLDAAWHHFEPLNPPTDPSSSEEDDHRVRCLSGRDAKDPVGGTWFGLSVPEEADREGKKIMRIGALTNIHDDVPLDPGPEGRRSRGGILKDYLQLSNDDLTEEYLRGLQEEERRYEGFGLGMFDVVFHPSNSTSTSNTSTENKVSVVSSYHSNRLSSETTYSRDSYELKDRPTWGMSNSIINKPLDKVKSGLRILSSTLESLGEPWSETNLIENLFHILRSDNGPIKTTKDLHKSIFVTRVKMPPSGLPSGKTPVSGDTSAERKDDHEGQEDEGREYGTRLSTVVLVKKDGEVLFIERDRAGEGKEEERRFRFQVGV